MPKFRDNKLYVDTKRGIVFHKPVEVLGVEYEPPTHFYEITQEQADRIENGESMNAVIRDGVQAKALAQLDEIPEAKEAPAKATKADKKKVPKKADKEGLLEMLPVLKSAKEIDQASADCGVDIPKQYETVEEKKEYLNTVLN